mgnify:FL=1
MDMNKQMQAFTGSETSDMFVSFDSVAPDDKIKLYNAINAPETRIADMVNKPICLTDVIMVKCKINDRVRSAERDAIRVILIDDNGETYAATSSGITNSVRNIFNIFGTLHFPEGLKVTIEQIKTSNGNTLTMKLMA